MSPDPRHAVTTLVTQVDITPQSPAGSHPIYASAQGAGAAQTALLEEILSAMNRQNKLLEDLISQQATPQRQRQQELEQWKQANPDLARRCRRAAESLGRVQAEFLDRLTVEVEDSEDGLLDGEFILGEFVDRFGPRLAHLNGVLQVLAQLSGPDR